MKRTTTACDDRVTVEADISQVRHVNRMPPIQSADPRRNLGERIGDSALIDEPTGDRSSETRFAGSDPTLPARRDHSRVNELKPGIPREFETSSGQSRGM